MMIHSTRVASSSAFSDSSVDIDRDLDAVLALPEDPSSYISNDNPGNYYVKDDDYEHELSDVYSLPPNKSTTNSSTELIPPAHPESTERKILESAPDNVMSSASLAVESGEHSLGLDSITQIDVLSRRLVRIHHGTISLGIVHAINDMVFDVKLESSAPQVPTSLLDLLQLLALQPIYALDVQPLDVNAVEIINDGDHMPSECEYQIKYITVPDGTLGVELSHVSLQTALGIAPGQSASHPSFAMSCGFLVGRYTNILHAPPETNLSDKNGEKTEKTSTLSIGDIIVAVNDVPIILLTAPTAASLLAQTKQRRFTVLRNATSMDRRTMNETTAKFLAERATTPQGRKRHRNFLRDETDRKFSHMLIKRRYDLSPSGSRKEKNKKKNSPLLTSSSNRDLFDRAECPVDFEHLPESSRAYRLSNFVTDLSSKHSSFPEEPDEGLHNRWQAVRRTFLCHTLYKPVLNRYPKASQYQASLPSPTMQNSVNEFVDDAYSQSYSQALYRQKFLEVIHAKDGSQELKNTLLKRFRRA